MDSIIDFHLRGVGPGGHGGEPPVPERGERPGRIELHTRDNLVQRIRPRLNLDVNAHWMCDYGRASFERYKSVPNATVRVLDTGGHVVADHYVNMLDVLERALSDPEARHQVDSGRMYEPFWYVHSPLTPPCPSRPFPGRPPRGQVPPPLPGVIVPDTPITDPEHPKASRLRDIAREIIPGLATTDPAPRPSREPAEASG